MLTTIPDRLIRAAENHFGSSMDQEKIKKLAGDASNRSYYRISSDQGTWIVMLLAEGQANSIAEEITKTDQAIREIPFVDVQRLLSKNQVLVPSIEYLDEVSGVMILQDFGDDLLLHHCQHHSKNKLPLYQNALSTWVKILSISRDSEPTSIAFHRKFDRDLYDWEFLHFVEYALDKRLMKKVTESDRNRILDSFANWSEKYTSWPLRLCHRDYHSRNLLVTEKEGNACLAVIDFQDALLAPVYYDLASLLRDSYCAFSSEELLSLLEKAHHLLYTAGIDTDVSIDEFVFRFDAMGLHRNLKAIGRFFYIDEVKGNPSYLADIPRSLSHIEASFERHDEFRDLKNHLLPMFEDLRSACLIRQ